MRTDWAAMLHMYLGYRVVEDDESLRALNRAIKIIRSRKSRAF